MAARPTPRHVVERSVLIVDDDPATCLTFGHALRTSGLRVETAATGRAALKSLRHKTFDLVSLDLRLPDMSGLDLIRITTRVPFILISGFLTTAETVEAMRLGARDVLEKPLDVDVLCKRVVSILGPRRSSRRGRVRKAVVPPPSHRVWSCPRPVRGSALGAVRTRCLSGRWRCSNAGGLGAHGRRQLRDSARRVPRGQNLPSRFAGPRARDQGARQQPRAGLCPRPSPGHSRHSHVAGLRGTSRIRRSLARDATSGVPRLADVRTDRTSGGQGTPSIDRRLSRASSLEGRPNSSVLRSSQFSVL